MQRELKFRCYWPNVNKMRYFVSGHFENTKRGWVMSFVMSDENEEKCIYLGSADVMQFTGLKDKNGKEIYEGDFVSTDLQRPFFQVVFKNGCFMARCFDDNEEYDDIFFPTSDEQKDIYPYGEVIGNIYETPELLKEQP